MIDSYDRLVGLIYDGATDDGSWTLALKQIADVVSAADVGLGLQDMRTHEFRSLGAFGIDPDLNPTYRRPHESPHFFGTRKGLNFRLWARLNRESAGWRIDARAEGAI